MFCKCKIYLKTMYLIISLSLCVISNWSTLLWHCLLHTSHVWFHSHECVKSPYDSVSWLRVTHNSVKCKTSSACLSSFHTSTRYPLLAPVSRVILKSGLWGVITPAVSMTGSYVYTSFKTSGVKHVLDKF